ncbi:MAG: hypothetical protein ABW321_19520 [Polyangiales bacterium]
MRKVADPYSETDVDYLVIGGETMSPDIVEVDKGTPGSFKTLQEAKSNAMGILRDRLSEGTDSLARLRSIGIEIPRLM